MAMFDLKDSEDIKLSQCHTDSSTLVKGDGVSRLEAENCSALSSSTPKKTKSKILEFLSKHLISTTLSLAVTLVGAYFTYKFGWTG